MWDLSFRKQVKYQTSFSKHLMKVKSNAIAHDAQKPKTTKIPGRKCLQKDIKLMNEPMSLKTSKKLRLSIEKKYCQTHWTNKIQTTKNFKWQLSKSWEISFFNSPLNQKDEWILYESSFEFRNSVCTLNDENNKFSFFAHRFFEFLKILEMLRK